MLQILQWISWLFQKYFYNSRTDNQNLNAERCRLANWLKRIPASAAIVEKKSLGKPMIGQFHDLK